MGAVSVAQQFGDDIRCVLATGLGDPLESLRILTLEADEDDQLRVGVAFVVLDVTGIELCQITVEIAGLRITNSPRA